MDIYLLICAALVFAAILLTPVSARVGAPLLLLFLAIIPVISPGPMTESFFNIVFVIVIVSLLLQGWTIPVVARWLGLAADGPQEEVAAAVEEKRGGYYSCSSVI